MKKTNIVEKLCQDSTQEILAFRFHAQGYELLNSDAVSIDQLLHAREALTMVIGTMMPKIFKLNPPEPATVTPLKPVENPAPDPA